MRRAHFSIRTAPLACALMLATTSSAAPPDEPATEQETGEDGAEDFMAEMDEYFAANEDKVLMPEVVDPQILDEAGQAAMRDAIRGYYEYRTNGYRHRSNVFEWQLFSSKLIFAIVVLLVSAGVFFSWMQFRAGMGGATASRRRRNSVEEVEAGTVEIGEDAEQVTTISISEKGLQLSSPILGVIILFISLAFLYLYLVYVYPIEEIF